MTDVGSYHTHPTPRMDDALPPPWNELSRVVGLHRRQPGEPVGVPQSVVETAGSLGALIVERAVTAGGATGAEALGTPDDTTPLPHPRTIVMLTHGGPRTADVQPDRPVAAGSVADPITGRTPRALDETGWDALFDAWQVQARVMLAWGAHGIGVEAARGHLMHSALSPLLGGDFDVGSRRLEMMVTRMAKFSPRVLVSLAVEDVYAGGIHARQGVTLARRLVDAGASMILVRTGGPHMPTRMVPPEPRVPEEEGPSLHAARWVKQAVPAAVVLVAGAIRSRRVAELAVERGVADGVVVGRPLRAGRVLE